MTDFQASHQAALAAAQNAAKASFDKIGHGDCCGFAWVESKVKMNTKEGKALKTLGFSKCPSMGTYLWNPAKYPTQSLTVHEDGARAYAKAMSAATGLEFWAASRMD